MEKKASALTSEEVTKMKEAGKLHRRFRFWYCLKDKTSDYLNAVQPLGDSFGTIQEFWNVYSFMKRPDQLPNGAAIHCFQDGIKPMWEDEANKDGGRFYLRVHKPYANRFWEDLLLGFLGEQCEENDVICGLIAQVRENEAKIDIWTKNLQDNQEIKKNVENWVKSSLGLSDKIDVDYKLHPREEQAGKEGGAEKGGKPDDVKMGGLNRKKL